MAIIFEPFQKQQQFIEAVFNPLYRFLLFGGAIRGGKSFVALATLILLCKLFPKSRWAVIRKDLQVIKRNTLPTFWKINPSNFLESFNNTDYVATYKNGSQILFMGENYDKDKELNRFRGLEVNGFVLEEMNELQEVTFNKCIERAGSNFINPMPMPKIIGTCNPSQNWVKTKFYLPWKEGSLIAPYYYLPSKIFDNPHVDADYLESLKSLPPEIYKVFVEGSWDASDDINQLIPWSAIYNCKDIIYEQKDEKFSLGVDVAGHGADKTVFILLKGQNIFDILTYPDTSIPDVTDKTKQLIVEYAIDTDRVVVDGAGLGAGVVDELARDNLYVVNFLGGAKAEDDDTMYSFKNLKSQAYWHLRTALMDSMIGNIENNTLQSDLTAIWYYIDGERCIRIESKDELKKRIGRSPDYADALCYAWWGRIYESIRKKPGFFFV